MNFLLPITAAILQASSNSLDKFILGFRGISYRTYISASFTLGFLVTLAIFFIFRPPIGLDLIYSSFLWLILSISITIASNMFFYRALDHDKLSELRTLDLFTAIPIIIWSSILFQSERNPFIIFLAIVATISVFWSHYESKHFKFSKFTKTYFIFSLTILPFGAIMSKILLETWNPISLELIRNGAFALILMPLLSRSMTRITAHSFIFLCLTNILTTLAWLLYFFSVKYSGLTYTILIFSVEPLLVYISAIVFFKEKLNKKKFAAFLLVLGSILAAQLI